MSLPRMFAGAALALGLAAGLASAQPDPPPADDAPRGGPRRPPSAEAVFKQIDADGDGAITAEEFAKHHEMMASRRPGGPPGFGPPGPGGRPGWGQGPPEGAGPGERGGGFGRGAGPRRDDQGRGGPPGPPPERRGGFGRGAGRGGPQGPPCPYCHGTGMAPPPPEAWNDGPPGPPDGPPDGPPGGGFERPRRGWRGGFGRWGDDNPGADRFRPPAEDPDQGPAAEQEPEGDAPEEEADEAL